MTQFEQEILDKILDSVTLESLLNGYQLLVETDKGVYWGTYEDGSVRTPIGVQPFKTNKIRSVRALPLAAVTVTSTPGTWTLDGEEYNSGDTATVEVLTLEGVTISFSDEEGYVTPSDVTIDLVAGETKTVEVTYEAE